MSRGARVVPLVALALLLFGCAEQRPPGTPGAKDIAVSVSCPPEEAEGPMSIQIRPGRAYVDPGQDATFRLEVRGPAAQSIQITAKNPQTWPYDQPALSGTHNTTVTFTGMPQNQSPSVHDYEIGFRCYGRDLTLDPRIIVRG